MAILSAAEVMQTLPEIIARQQSAVIQSGGEDVALIIPLRRAAISDQEEQSRWQNFLKLRDQVAAELAVDLAKEGITVDAFLEDVLKDV